MRELSTLLQSIHTHVLAHNRKDLGNPGSFIKVLGKGLQVTRLAVLSRKALARLFLPGSAHQDSCCNA
jgi:hypothetical protein